MKFQYFSSIFQFLILCAEVYLAPGNKALLVWHKLLSSERAHKAIYKGTHLLGIIKREKTLLPNKK